ncbi:hypothetical protein BJX61DRAFT_540743 [Aspergillus egyptiacus]|nr:hypothetical protein BJX61DRAFT_540743 [Aspergillus egyptiacus]
MYRGKPKLSLSIAAAQSTVSRPSLSLKSPGLLTSPRSPLPPSPAATSKRFSTLQAPAQQMQAPSYNYVNACSSKSILKKSATGSSTGGKRIQFQGSPTVHCITPIENTEEYYGSYTKLSREERRWIHLVSGSALSATSFVNCPTGYAGGLPDVSETTQRDEQAWIEGGKEAGGAI